MSTTFFEGENLTKRFGGLNPAETELVVKSMKRLHKGEDSVGYTAKGRLCLL
jgi:hypothetical protein